MRHAFIAAQLLWEAQAARDVDGDEPRGQAGSPGHRLRPALGWGALTLLALVALATVVGG
jgi:hypothetical protein